MESTFAATKLYFTELDRTFGMPFDKVELERLDEFELVYDKAKNRMGQTNYTTREISLSEHFVLAADIEDVRITIRHEIAHALAGGGNGHNHIWANRAIRLGINPDRTRAVKMDIPSRYTGECGFGCVTQIHRIGKAMRQGRVVCVKHRQPFAISTN